MTTLSLLLILSVCNHVTATFNSNVCSNNPQVTAPGPTRPNLPSRFEVYVDCEILDQNQTIAVHQYYDQTRGTELIQQTTVGVPVTVRYVYTNNEQTTIFPDSDGFSLCSVTELSSTRNRRFFTYNSGHGRVFSPAEALHSPGVTEVYEGRDKVRGIVVQKWTSCQYWKDMDATMNVTWYYSDPLLWDSALGLRSAPVRVAVRGVVNKSVYHHAFHHNYDFIHFVPNITSPEVFNIPSFVTCSGQKLTKQIPKLSPAFSFSVEILDEISEDVSYRKEWHDETLKLTKFTHTPTLTSGSGEFGYRPLTEIHDFNTGVAYIIDDERGNCTYRGIDGASLDAFMKDPAHIRIRTAREYFRLDKVDDLTYRGLTNTRGVHVDAFAAMVPDYHNATMEWYFKENSVVFVQEQRSTFKGGNPVQVRARIPQLNQEYTLNIYNYIQAQANIVHWDIRQCYTRLDRRRFQVTVPSVYSQAIASNPENFKYALLQTLSQMAQVFPLRIAGIRVEIQKNVTVQFDLLDVTPIHGSNVTQTPLETAASTLVSAIHNGRFVVLMSAGSEKRPTTITVIPSSLKEIMEGPTSSVATSSSTANTATIASTSSRPSSFSSTKTSSRTQGTASVLASTFSKPRLFSSTATVTKTSSRTQGTASVLASSSRPSSIPSAASVTKTSSQTRGTASTKQKQTLASKTTASLPFPSSPPRLSPKSHASTFTSQSHNSHVTSTPPSNQGTSSSLGLCDTKSSGYSGGVAIGVSAAMMVLGGIIGTVVAYYFKRNRRFRRFFNEDMTMTDLRVHNSS